MRHSIFKIGAREVGQDKLFFVAEEGQANLGDFDKAISMVDAAEASGADAIEFQVGRAEDFYVKNDPRYEIYLRREFSISQLTDLVAYTKSKGIEFIAVPLSHKLVEPLAKAGCAGLNVNASDLTNPHIIDAVVDSGCPFFLSLPLATEEEIDWAVNRITKKGASNYALLHGQHTMAGGESGVGAEHTSLGYIAILKERYRVPVGFIDHTPLPWLPASAVSAGADVVSKHLVLSRSDKGPDWQVALEPEEMKETIAWARKMRESIRTNFKKLAPGEDIDKSRMRRSIVAARRLKAGEIITQEDILFKRPGIGLCPSKFEEIIGKIAVREIQPDEPIKLTDTKEI